MIAFYQFQTVYSRVRLALVLMLLSALIPMFFCWVSHDPIQLVDWVVLLTASFLMILQKFKFSSYWITGFLLTSGLVILHSLSVYQGYLGVDTALWFVALYLFGRLVFGPGTRWLALVCIFPLGIYPLVEGMGLGPVVDGDWGARLSLFMQMFLATSSILLAVHFEGRDARVQQEALEWDSRRHRALLGALPDVVWVQGLHQPIVEEIRIPERTEWPPGIQDLKGKNPFEVLAPALAHALENAIDALKHQGGVTHFEYRIGGQNARSFGGSIALGDDDRIVVVLRDHTELRRAEERLREENRRLQAAKIELQIARERAELSEAAKSRFLSTMSHEIRTPINALIGASDLLSEDNPKPEQVETLQMLRFASDHLLHLVNDILDYNKLDAGKLRTESLPLVLKEWSHLLVQSWQPKAKDVGIRLVLDCEDVLLRPVLTDTTRWGQILNNLVGNALKFTPEGGVVRVELRKIEDHQRIWIEGVVSDTGIGIPSDALERLFQPFEQAGPEIARLYGGSGLGLAIVKKLVELLGGKIHVQSEPGWGTQFRFTIPLEWAPIAAASHEDNAVQENLGKAQFSGRVLLIEDNVMNQKLITKMLTRYGLVSQISGSGEDGLLAFDDGSWDLILVDLHLPGIDGLETARQLRQKGCRAPLVLMTADHLEGLREIARQAGVNAFLDKPFHMKDLELCLLRWLPSAN